MGTKKFLSRRFGQLREHLRLRAANQDRRERSADAIELAVANDLSVLVVYLVVGQEPERRPEAVPVDEADDRGQFLETILQGRPGEDDRVG